MIARERLERIGGRMSVDVRSLMAAGVLIGGATLAQGVDRTASRTQAPPTTVVVAELFTSEGCSSCPPADDVLADLVMRQPVPGVEVLALAEHVDYWDRLGWRDRFSSAAFSARQSDYDARVFRTGGIYTPQLVVDGQIQVVGSDDAAVGQAIRRAARMPKATVAIAAVAQPHDRDRARVEVHANVPAHIELRGDVDVLVAVVEDNLTTAVRRGENGGRTLRHTAVVRSLTAIGTLAPRERAWSSTASVSFARDSKLENLRAIAWLQERDTRRIVGAAATHVVVDTRIQ
jgi:hypothetical protein